MRINEIKQLLYLGNTPHETCEPVKKQVRPVKEEKSKFDKMLDSEMDRQTNDKSYAKQIKDKYKISNK